MNYLLNRRKAFRTTDVVSDYVAKYIFEGNGNDVTGNHNASMSNVTYSDSGQISAANGKYSIYNGTTSYGQVTDHADITDLKSVCAWINMTSWGSASGARIVDKSSTWILTLESVSGYNDNSIVFGKDFSTTNGRWCSPLNSISLSSWYHVGYTYAMDGNVATNPIIYINGASVTVTEVATPVGTITSDTSNDLYLGNNAANDREFDGNMDNVRLYDRVLTPTEMLEIYDAEKP